MLEGVGKEAETVVNERGGKQSKVEYRFDLLPPQALAAVAKVLKEGAVKYGENNWHNIDSGDHLNHALIHIYADLAGDNQDDHLEHAACRILMALEMRIRERSMFDAGGVALSQPGGVPPLPEIPEMGKVCLVSEADSFLFGKESFQRIEWDKEYNAYRAFLHHDKGGNPAEWPEDLQIREWPEVKHGV